MDRLIHPYYTEDMGWYPDKPFELKHVYDTKEDRYVINEEQCCYYSPTSKHQWCTHKYKCIFDNERWEYYDEELHIIVSQIKEIRQIMEDYENIKQNLLNGDIIYHDTLEEYYIISKEKNDDGSIRIDVDVAPNFKNIINLSLTNLKLELRELNRELLRIKRRR